MKAAAEELMKDLIGVSKFFAWAPAQATALFFFTKGAEYLYRYIGKIIDLKAIVIKNESARAELSRAALSLKETALLKGIDSDEYKSLRKDHGDRLLAFVSYSVRQA